MFNLIKAEFYKLKTSKTFLVIVFLNIIQSILCPIIITMSRTMNGKKVLMVVLGAQEFIGLYFFIALFAAYYICDDFYSGCIKQFISYGHKRQDIVIAKSIVYYVGIIIIFSISPILITIINTIINGYGEPFTLNSLIDILKIALPMMFIYVGISSIALLISYIWRNSIITTIVTISIDPINRICRAASIKNDKLRAIYDKTVFGQSLVLNISYIDSFIILKIMFIVLVTVIFSTLISIYFFKRCDIK